MIAETVMQRAEFTRRRGVGAQFKNAILAGARRFNLGRVFRGGEKQLLNFGDEFSIRFGFFCRLFPVRIGTEGLP
jgi:hypothetical protein